MKQIVVTVSQPHGTKIVRLGVLADLGDGRLGKTFRGRNDFAFLVHHLLLGEFDFRMGGQFRLVVFPEKRGYPVVGVAAAHAGPDGHRSGFLREQRDRAEKEGGKEELLQ